ncbi:hypothetical protein ILUMI_01662 [Ignelater luminosus]|uniref:Amino acid transporter transmembrane domain-containing protein n=1 Tax=Ignelater luminosus TaxID=2038154 RepID=A0A8K0GLI2_IGNLU|nr:hypothetical protein ILUMI_01662 [Ignelater luminosus]
MSDKRQKELEKIKERYAAEADGNVENYDPYKYRNTTHGTTFLESLIHVLKASLGVGILAMPEAFKHAGVINGFVFTIIIGFLCTYGIHMLVRSQYALCTRLRVPYLTYSVAMKVALLYGPKSFAKFGTASQ